MRSSGLRQVRRLVVVASVLTFVAQVLGLMFWAGYARQWMPLHIAAGLLLVAALWSMACLAAKWQIDRRRVVLAAVWGLLMIGLGFWQADLLTGERHRMIRTLHLIAGVAAIRQIFWMAKAIRVKEGKQSPV